MKLHEVVKTWSCKNHEDVYKHVYKEKQNLQKRPVAYSFIMLHVVHVRPLACW